MQDTCRDRKIVCDVKSCIYNGQDKSCTAKQIQVGPTGADCCSETVCETFTHE